MTAFQLEGRFDSTDSELPRSAAALAPEHQRANDQNSGKGEPLYRVAEMGPIAEVNIVIGADGQGRAISAGSFLQIKREQRIGHLALDLRYVDPKPLVQPRRGRAGGGVSRQQKECTHL